jgi:hypothetical protein
LSPAPARIDWVEAEHFYLSLGPVRTYVAVADRYGLTEGAVRRQAGSRDWREKALVFDAEVAAKVRPAISDKRARRIANTLALVDGAVAQLLKAHEDGSLDVRLADIPNLVKLAELLEGEPTERVSLGDLRAFMFELRVRLVPIVGPERVEELAEAMTAAAAVVASDLALSPGSSEAA